MENVSWDLPRRNTCVFARLALQEKTVKTVIQPKRYIHNTYLSAVEIPSSGKEEEGTSQQEQLVHD